MGCGVWEKQDEKTYITNLNFILKAKFLSLSIYRSSGIGEGHLASAAALHATVGDLVDENEILQHDKLHALLHRP